MNTATREIMWNVHSLWDTVLMYSFMIIALVIALVGIISRAEMWALGSEAPETRGSIITRLDKLCLEGLFQRKFVRQGIQAAFHTMIYLGFLVLLFTTTMVFIDHDLGFRIYQGKFYLAVTIMSDIFGVILLLGVAIAWYRRKILSTDQIHNRPLDGLALGVLAILVIQGYLLEGLRIHVTHDPWAWYSPVGLITSKLLWGLSPLSASVLHYLIWWFHTLTVFSALAVFPYTKFFHIISSSANLYFQDLNRVNGKMKSTGDLEKLMEESDDFSIGANSLKEFSWKQLLSLDACTSCGRCQDACPAYASGTPLSPKWVILDTRNHALAVHASRIRPDSWIPVMLQKLDIWLITNLLLGGSGARPLNNGNNSLFDGSGEYRGINKRVQNAVKTLGGTLESPIADGVIDQDVFWSCTTCMACVEACPVGISPMDEILDIRRSLTLMSGSLPSEAQATMRALETRGNPYGPREARADWAKDLGIKFLKPGEKVEYLYWVGCVSAFDQRKQKIARAMTEIMQQAGISFGILGSLESCSGDPARRLGEENLFQTLTKGNLDVLQSVEFDTLVTNCPHCFNTLENEYGEFGPLQKNGKTTEIIHHSVLLDRLIKAEKITLNQSAATVTFHDPCYLGRYNGEYYAPRNALKAIPGLKILEMDRSREKAMCCGAGGGHFWMDLKNGDTRVNTLRVEQAAETKASCIATACPFCMQMLEDGTKLTSRDEKLKVLDIAELVAEGMVKHAGEQL